ncbi:MAG: DNA-binding transcriptional regulator Fis [Gammaproteobacteria bacterium]|nr:DNA-binding transcriptional regulator Fis [Gammaproteobacteria bacterium]MAY02011.1 DNA-binding transcriptional regulator Fis [Gammaproteobacteria bacterium]|tara:strand:- start:907 stop:1152 length:246 start_codon:yes stop_codon:yes gene_type:complete
MSDNKPQTLKQCVNEALEDYLNQVEPEHISDLYTMVLAEVEAPMLAVVMKHARSNQSKAASMLGLNRGTLRKKLRQYRLLD